VYGGTLLSYDLGVAALPYQEGRQVTADIISSLHELTLTDVIIIAGILAYVADRIIDSRGWSRSSKTLRLENGDLIRRNDELERDVDRHEKTIADQGAKILRLEDQVRSLEKLDQSAVLQALKDHEVGAMERAEETHRLLGESTVQLVRIATVLEGGTQSE
jgi:hypothetical protein